MKNPKDSYVEFLKLTSISEEFFVNCGIDLMKFPTPEIVENEWNSLKTRINNKDPLTIRSYGRNGANSYLFVNFYRDVFNINIEIDSTNNSIPQQSLSRMTQLKLNEDLLNYQVSHLFGNRTKNIYLFEASWNIAYIPKLYDPFTGHEASGKIKALFYTRFMEEIRKKYIHYIDDYNKIMDEIQIEDKIEKYIAKLSQSNIDRAKLARFKNDLISNFSKL